MQIDVNGIRLWFDVDGPALVPDGSQMRQRPTILLVHGGPGVYDHSYFKPDFVALAEHAQIVYLDLRGHGRSYWGDAGEWSFEACADDIHGFCDAVGITRPIVLGHSMGAPIVLLYGVRHPGHPVGLIVQSGFARWDPERLVEGFRRVAGNEIAEIAGRSYAGENVSAEDSARVFAAFGPHLPDEEREANTPNNAALNTHGMELIRKLDVVQQLSRIDCPTLISVGEFDPVTPIAAADEIVAALPDGTAQLEIIPGAGQFPWLDAPAAYWPPLIEFITTTDECDPLRRRLAGHVLHLPGLSRPRRGRPQQWPIHGDWMTDRKPAATDHRAVRAYSGTIGMGSLVGSV